MRINLSSALQSLCAACPSLSSINLKILPPSSQEIPFHLSTHYLVLSFSFYRWQQWQSLPHVQINTSSPDVFNTMPSVAPLGFFFLFGSFYVGRGCCFLFLPSHYFYHSAGQSPYPLQLPSWTQMTKMFIGRLDFMTDLLDLVTRVAFCFFYLLFLL